jgi:hypothetical protein
MISLQGRTYMPDTDCPFRKMDQILRDLDPSVKVRFVDFHAEVTSEKMAMGWYLDGRVSAMVGTHTHVPTADTRILPGGTAYQTDVGMTGPYDSVIGVKKEAHYPALPDGAPGAHGSRQGFARTALGHPGSGREHRQGDFNAPPHGPRRLSRNIPPPHPPPRGGGYIAATPCRPQHRTKKNPRKIHANMFWFFS